MSESELHAGSNTDLNGETRPWGRFIVLDDTPTCKVKRIIVEPGQRLSYQLHHRRAEHWTVVSGTALVTLNGEDITVEPGASIDIPRGADHRVRNPGNEPLEFIEVQMGDYFGEDDIVRLEDDYGRAGQ
ncbi:MAG: cupin domain-containing protein [Actinobacteria bacterium]|nr:cupin domain-containing protein [Actinomycetota bacterium]